MPIIRIDFDGEKISNQETSLLSNSIQKIVSEATKIADVFAYANSPQIKVNIAPIEVFIEMSAEKINSIGELLETIKSSLQQWKKDESFSHPINLTLIPMKWKLEINI